MIDFGGDSHSHPPPARQAPQPPRQQPPPPPPLDKPVSKSERFAEDFDRSWPRSAQQQAAEEAQRAPDLRKRESDRVLFNASSNRLENPSSRPPASAQPAQPTRLMSRTENPPAQAPATGQHPVPPAGGRVLQRQPPPHLANLPDTGRQLPPHMADNVPTRPPPPSNSQHQQPQSGRIPWSNHRDTERHLPPHMANRPDMPPQSSAFESSRSPPTGPGSGLPPRRSFGQSTSAPMAPPQQHQQPAPAPPAAPVADPTDSQAAEMHSAAEKARLRREAEEVERKAAAERAKQKAREMEAKLGPKSTPQPPQPPAVAQTPSYTIAQRPKPPVETPAQAPAVATSSYTGGNTSAIAGSIQRRPSMEQSRGGREEQWRAREPSQTQQAPPITLAQRDQVHQSRPTASSHQRVGRPTAESFFAHENENTPPHATLRTPQAGAVNLSPDVPELTDAELDAILSEIPPGQEEWRGFGDKLDDTMARIKAAIGGSKANASEVSAPTPAGKGSRRRVSESLPAQPSTAAAARSAPTIQPRPVTPESFSITQPPIPRSPPPAWRTYVVRLPKESKPVPVISQSQLAALQRTKQPARGWPLSFNPPLDLPSHSLSRTDLLLPGANLQRLARGAPVQPSVSVSKGTLEPVVKKDTRQPSQSTSRHAGSGISSFDTVPTAHQLQSRSAGRWRQSEEQTPVAPEPIATQAAIDLLDAPAPVPAKSPAKLAAVTQPEPSATTSAPARYEGVNIGPSAKLAATAGTPDPKSGVRYMVSSELEGDSLLDEVNKMSLETVEEAGMKDTSAGKPAGIEVSPVIHPMELSAADNGQLPRSPVPHNGPNAVRTLPSSPNGNITWNASHEHLKNVWQQAPQTSSDPQTAVLSNSTAVPDAIPTPLYPSLNSLSATESNPAQSAQQHKLSYPSQTFSPTSATFSSLRHSPAGYAPSPSNAENMAGLSYARNPQHVNGYSSMSQQGLWSAPGFGSGTPGYGYTAKSPNGIDQKAAMAFNSAAGGGSPYVYGQSGGYTSLPSVHSPYGQYSSAQQQQQHHSRVPSTSNGAYGYSGYTQSGGGRSMSGRFAQTNGGNEYGQQVDGGYYGYVGGGQSTSLGQQQQTQQQQAAQGQVHGQNQGMYYQTAGAGGGAGAVGQQQSSGQRRKMW